MGNRLRGVMTATVEERLGVGMDAIRFESAQKLRGELIARDFLKT